MILGIESSCDESALALLIRKKDWWVNGYSQISQHAEYGGIVPDIIIRQHLNQFFPCLMRCVNTI